MQAQRVVGPRRRTQNPMIAGLVAIGPNYGHCICFDTEAKYTFSAAKDYSTSVSLRVDLGRERTRAVVSQLDLRNVECRPCERSR
jgi:hypothetical protein